MKVTQPSENDQVVEVICDACGMSARGSNGELQFGAMHASWGEGSAHSGEKYELHLCESCFFAQVSAIKRARWLGQMFDEEGDTVLFNDAFGRIENGKPGNGGSESR